MGGGPSIFEKWNKELRDKGDARRIAEMKEEKGIHFPSPGENLTEMPSFSNAGDAMTYVNRLTPAQLKQVKDIKFRVGGRMPMSITERINLSPMNYDSLTKLETSSALQEVFKKIKNQGSGIEEWVGAKNGGKIAPPAPMIGVQHKKRGGF